MEEKTMSEKSGIVDYVEQLEHFRTIVNYRQAMKCCENCNYKQVAYEVWGYSPQCAVADVEFECVFTITNSFVCDRWEKKKEDE